VIAVSEPESDSTRERRTPGPIRVLLVMAGEVGAQRVMKALDEKDELELVGLAASKDAALPLATELLPDVVLVDAELADAAATSQLLKEQSFPVLILTGGGATVSDTLVDDEVVASGFVDGTLAASELGTSLAVAAALAAAQRPGQAQSET
jgi:chemotaxis response regulator CheB